MRAQAGLTREICAADGRETGAEWDAGRTDHVAKTERVVGLKALGSERMGLGSVAKEGRMLGSHIHRQTSLTGR